MKCALLRVSQLRSSQQGAERGRIIRIVPPEKNVGDCHGATTSAGLCRAIALILAGRYYSQRLVTPPRLRESVSRASRGPLPPWPSRMEPGQNALYPT